MTDDPVLHSRRTLSLRFDIPISRTREFWDAIREGRFVTTKCASCGNLSFPPQADCPRCMGSTFEWFDLGRDATLVTFTHVRIAPASFADRDPYIIAIGEFPAGVKALAWLEGVKPDNAKVGMKLKVEARGSGGGNPYYVFVAV
jgi:uncharacterized OB-fold protein